MLTQEQLAQFHRDGFLVVRGVFVPAEVGMLREAADEVTRAGVAGEGDGHGYRDTARGREYYRTDGVLWQRHAAFRIATVNPTLLAVVGQCLGHAFMPVNDSLVVKPPHSHVSIPWHQDPPYQGPDGRPETFEVPNFDCDIYLDDANLENGCLHALVGHHLAGHVEVERFSDDELFGHTDTAPIEVAAGDVLLHAISTPHGSRANASDGLRRVFYVHFMAREVLAALHPQWAGSRHAFGADGVARVRAMIDERRHAGLHGLETVPMELATDGLRFTGDPVTPPRHWRQLLDDQPPERRQAARTLAVRPRSPDHPRRDLLG